MAPDDHALRDRLEAALGQRFTIGATVGSGGFAVVFEALDKHLNSKIAIKVLRPELVDRGGGERFLREVRILAELRHPGIVPILDAYQQDGLFAYMMPLIQGPTLREQLANSGALPMDQALRLLGEMGEAVDFAHRKGILHRDLKPANILLSEGHALLTDFGIARAFEGAESEALTQTGLSIGTVGYMSPEQASGNGRVDARTDLYALAVIGYEMIGGRRPFIGDSSESTLRQQLLAAPTPLNVLRGSATPALAAAVARGLAPNPADRFASAAEFLRACQAPETAPTATPSAPFQPALAQSKTSRASGVRLKVIAGFVLAAGLISVGIWGAGQIRGRSQSLPDTPGRRRAWFVVAQVETRPEDPTLAAAVKSLVSSTLERSPALGVLSDVEIAHVLQSAAKPESTALNPELAMEVAVRALVSGVIVANVERVGKEATISIRAVNTAQDSILVSTSATTDRDAELLPTIRQATESLQRDLAQRAAMLASAKLNTIDDPTVTTPDLHAFRLFGQSGRALDSGEFRDAIYFARGALARDSAFARAWDNLGLAYANQGLNDSALIAYRNALRHSERLTDAERLLIQGGIGSILGDMPAALQADDRMLALFPQSSGGWNNRGSALSSLGRFDEALASYRKALEALENTPGSPAGRLNRRSGMSWNAALVLVAMGRIASADSIRITLPSGERQDQVGLWLAVAQTDPVRIETASRRVLARSGASIDVVCEAYASLAGWMANHGQLKDAWEQLHLGGQAAADAQNSSYVDWADQSRALLALAYAQPPDSRPAAAVTESANQQKVTRALFLLAEGKLKEARPLVRELQTLKGDDLALLDSAPDFLGALLASKEGRPRDVIRIARIHACEVRQPSAFNILRPASRLLVAQAYRDLSEPDSAAHYYGLALARTGMNPEEMMSAALIEAPIRQRLALVELKRNHVEEARRQADLLARMFDRPDPEVRPLLDELQTALSLVGRSVEQGEASPGQGARASGRPR